MSYWIPTYLKDMAAYIKDPTVYMYGRWNHPPSAMEGGVDLTSPGGTPVYALASGQIIGLGNFWHSASIYTPNSGPPGYGVVTTRVDIPGYGQNDLYYQHIQIESGLKVGDTVQRGQKIGTIIASVGELEMGLNADWGGIWGTDHPAPWATDPRPQIKALMALGQPGTVTAGNSQISANSLAAIGQAVLKDVGVSQTAIDALNVANGNVLAWIGGALVFGSIAAAAGILFLLTGV